MTETAPALETIRTSTQSFWDISDYQGIVPVGSGLGEAKQRAAAKLASSAVAPLVAAARGVRAYTDPAEKSDLFAAYGLKEKNSGQARGLVSRLESTDVMLMPWYTIAEIKAFAERPYEGLPEAPFNQVRPGDPLESKDANGRKKTQKYLTIADAKTVIGAHPGQPLNFTTEPDVLLIAEGALKADAALTGYLLDCGVPIDELSAPIDKHGSRVSHAEAVVRLRTLMETYCEATDSDGKRMNRRILIVSLVGVGTWHKNAVEWNQIPMRGIETWVGFDADMQKNIHVWKQANALTQMLEKNGVTAVKYLTPTAKGEDAADSKLGIDDYLAAHGSFHQLTHESIIDSMPEQPKANFADLEGRIRVTESGTSVVKYVGHEYDGVKTVRPQEIIGYGGQIVERVRRRQVTDQEERLGQFEPEDSFVDANVPMEEVTTIEVMWNPRDDNGEPITDQVVTRQIRGPVSILNSMPDQWAKGGAHIHSDILQLPDWPPQKGREFRDAIRERSLYGEHASRSVTEWMQMGWVPQREGDPVFIVGDDVIARRTGAGPAAETANRREYSRPGLSSNRRYAPMSSRFGFGDFTNRSDQWEAEGASAEGDAFRTYARDIFTEVMSAYFHSGIWPADPRNPNSRTGGIAPLVVAAGLRPAIPLQDTLNVYLRGGPGSGKSWTAAAIAAFWQRNPDEFNEQDLLGAANDTFAYTEDMVSHFPLWIIDDLAPTPDRVKEKQEQGKIADLIRAKFNKKGRGRAGVSSDGVKAQESKTPRALLVFTAENALPIPSAMHRALLINFRKGDLGENIGPVTQLRAETTKISEMTGIVVGYIQWRVAQEGWEAVVERFRRARKRSQNSFKEIFKKRSKQGTTPERSAAIAADVMIVIDLLGEIARELDLDDTYTDLFDADSLPDQILDLLIAAHRDSEETQRGYQFVEAIQKILRLGYAHILDFEDPSRPPALPESLNPESDHVALGWYPGGEDRGYSPRGQCIGSMRIDKATGRAFLAINPADAFAIARERITGINDVDERNSVDGVYSEGLAASYMTPEKNRRAPKITTFEAKDATSAAQKRQRRVLALDAETFLSGPPRPDDHSSEADDARVLSELAVAAEQAEEQV